MVWDERRLTVDTAHLLSDHDSRGTIVGSPDPRHGETVPQTGEVAGTTTQFEFLGVYHVWVVEVPCGDDGIRSQAHHWSEPLCVLAVLHEPTRGLGTKPDTTAEDEGWDEGWTELKTPSDTTSVFDNDVGGEAQEDTCRPPLANVSGRATRSSSPATTQSCQNMTRAPRIRAGAISAE